MYYVVVKKFTFAISSPDEFLFHQVLTAIAIAIQFASIVNNPGSITL